MMIIQFISYDISLWIIYHTKHRRCVFFITFKLMTKWNRFTILKQRF